jgi:hypothetical protein
MYLNKTFLLNDKCSNLPLKEINRFKQNLPDLFWELASNVLLRFEILPSKVLLCFHFRDRALHWPAAVA